MTMNDLETTMTQVGPGHWRVHTAPPWHVDLVGMMFNFRVVLTPIDSPHEWTSGWCFFGRSRDTWIKAALAAIAFDPRTELAPANFDKAVGVIRAPHAPLGRR